MIAMLSLALLPIGLIAIMQTRSVTMKAQENSELALMVLTEQVALRERLYVQRAVGSATAIAAVLPRYGADPEACSQSMARLIERTQRFSFAAFVPAGPGDLCIASKPELAQDTIPNLTYSGPATEVQIAPQTNYGPTPMMSMSQTVVRGGQPIGKIVIGVTHKPLELTQNDVTDHELVDFITFDRDGNILTGHLEYEKIAAELPRGRSLGGLASVFSNTFTDENRNGEQRIYTQVPLQGQQIYVLGIWGASDGLSGKVSSLLPTSAFPALMWMSSLVVALLAIHRLIARHVRRIELQMTRFARDRALPDEAQSREMPTELQNIQNAFLSMADSILHDEAELENVVHQKNVLLKEVHHRVKNNLQLISSILNMQIRDADHPDTKRVLRRMQDRVLSLATIHRDLYQSNESGRVNVGSLLREIVEKTVEIGAVSDRAIKVTSNIDDIFLYPDQAVPMSLLASEAATNAMKYVGPPGSESPCWIDVSFTATEDDTCVFEFANSVGDAPSGESTGLGKRLINAFAIQLGAKIEIDDTESAYRITVTFNAQAFAPEPGNY